MCVGEVCVGGRGGQQRGDGVAGSERRKVGQIDVEVIVVYQPALNGVVKKVEVSTTTYAMLIA